MTHSAESLPPIIQAMLNPEFYSHPVTHVELKQTHTSYVLLAGDFAYKVRKPIRFAFIDCSTARRRSMLCRREVELNRRLSPDVYLAVVAIGQTGNQFVVQQGAHEADAVEFAVKMRRLPDELRLDLMIKQAIITSANIRQIASTIRNFHAAMPNTRSWDYGAAATIWRLTIANLIEIEQLSPPDPILSKIAQIEAYSRHFIAAHWELLNRRAREQYVHEGHGDLRADAVYLTPNRIEIIDCLEFDERLRYVDITNEISFLAMDIDRLGRHDLATELVAHFADDPDVTLLMHFYESYRATVRAKVELLRSHQQDCSADDKQTALASAEQLLDLAINYTEGPRELVIVCGASGAGKSTLAAMLSERLGLAVLSSDVMRKRLARTDPATSAAAAYNQGIYAPEFTARVYALLAADAKRVLNTGKGVILDATFGKRSERLRLIGTMKEVGVEPLFIECCAEKDAIIQRLSQREHDPQRFSDANVRIYMSQIKDFDPLDEIPPRLHEVVDTTEGVRDIVLKIERRICSRPYSRARFRESTPNYT